MRKFRIITKKVRKSSGETPLSRIQTLALGTLLVAGFGLFVYCITAMAFGLRYPTSKHSDYVSHLGSALLFQSIPEMEQLNKKARRYRAVVVRRRINTPEFTARDAEDAHRRLARKYGINATVTLEDITK